MADAVDTDGAVFESEQDTVIAAATPERPQLCGFRQAPALLSPSALHITSAFGTADARARSQSNAIRRGLGCFCHHGYNARLEVSGVTATLSSTQLLGLTLGYAAADNGNVMSEAITRPGLSLSRSFTYDNVNRLKTASEGSNWNQTYVYDAVGNQALTASSSVIGSGLTPQTNSTTSVPFNGKNQWLGGTYDAGTGRLSATGTQTFQYDAEQRLIQQADSGNLVTFGYDGDGRRVMKTSNNVTTVYVYDAL